MQELFQKYLDNQCSPEEVKELLALFNNPENEARLRVLIFDSLGNMNADDDERQWHGATVDSFGKIKKQLGTGDAKVVPFFKKKWVRIAAAAILLVGTFSIYQYFNNAASGKQQIVSSDTIASPISPGAAKAILTLADGSTINLETAAGDNLAEQGNTGIFKLAGGRLVYKSLNEKPAQSLFNNITTPKGGQYQVTLSDGTRIWLNAASTIHFPVAFAGNERLVEITGEAYFEVAKNASMPFKVRIGNKAEVEVLGTHFNIEAYSDEPTLNTTLLEGSVKVTGLVQHDSRTIVPGEQAQLNASNQIQVSKPTDVNQVIAWKTGVFNFENADLETALRELARWYDVEVVFEGAIPQKQFTGEIQRSLTLPQVLQLLEKNGVHSHVEGKKLIVLK